MSASDVERVLTEALERIVAEKVTASRWMFSIGLVTIAEQALARVAALRTQQEPEGAVSDTDIAAWAERHDYYANATDLRAMFEDAASIAALPIQQSPQAEGTTVSGEYLARRRGGEGLANFQIGWVDQDQLDSLEHGLSPNIPLWREDFTHAKRLVPVFISAEQSPQAAVYPAVEIGGPKTPTAKGTIPLKGTAHD